MKILKIIGITTLLASILLLIFYGLYELFAELFKNLEIPFIIKLGITGLILGIVITLISLTIERIKDKNKEI